MPTAATVAVISLRSRETAGGMAEILPRRADYSRSGGFDLANALSEPEAGLFLGGEVDLDVDGFGETGRIIGTETEFHVVDDEDEAENRLAADTDVSQIPRPESATVGPHAHAATIELDADTQRTVAVAESMQSAVESLHQPVCPPMP